MILGIDAHCLRAGGGITHLREVLRVANPAAAGFTKVVLWSGQETLDSIDDRAWLAKVHDPLLDRGLVARSYWSSLKVSGLARDAGCSVLWVPGCSFWGSFRPFVAMSRNMLPFQWSELRRYAVSRRFLKFLLLHVANSRTYRRSDGMIYLTEYARASISAVIGKTRGDSRVIPHGVEARFSPASTTERSTADVDSDVTRLLYVSAVDLYKHQWRVVEAVELLQKQGFAVELTLVGPSLPDAERRLRGALKRFGGTRGSVKYVGAVKHAELPRYYQDADVFVYASSCENLPNILLEAMASAKPIASSSRGPMPEVLKDGGLYFDPEEPSEIAMAIRQFIQSPELRTEKAQLAFRYSRSYSWHRCASESFEYLAAVASRFHAGTSTSSGQLTPLARTVA